MVKLNLKQKLIIAFIFICLILTILLLLINAKDDKFNFNQTDVILPSPSSSNPTSFFSHPQIIKTEKELENIQSNLNQLEIDHHPLLPPNLDMDVNLNK